MNLYQAGTVTYPASQVIGMRESIDEGTKADTLYTSGHRQVYRLEIRRYIVCIEICGRHAEACFLLLRTTGSRIPADHQMRQAPSSDTMQGPIG